MINKQNLWFITLFSLILVLSIYYLTMPESTLKSLTAGKTENNYIAGEIEESSLLVALRIEADEETLAQMDELQNTLLNEATSVEEKNEAYEALKELNINKGKEEELEKIINDEFKLKSFVKIKGDQISIVIASGEHNSEIANNIMRKIQEGYDTKMYITVKFQK